MLVVSIRFTGGVYASLKGFPICFCDKYFKVQLPFMRKNVEAAYVF